MTPAWLAALATKGVTADDLKAWQRVVGAKPDGDPGPATFAATVAWFRDRGHIAPPVLPAEARLRVVAIARAELGEQDPQRYYRDAAPQFVGVTPNAIAWCGVFALWCYRKAGLTSKTWVTGRGFAEGYMPRVQLPEPGDLAYYASGQHYAIVEAVGAGKVHTIDGNAMRAPLEGVVMRTRALTDAAAYYSIARLV